MKVLITFAVDAEFAPWRRLRKFDRSKLLKTGSPTFTTELEANRVTVYLTGMGANASKQSLAALDFTPEEKPDLVISSGLAGALSEQLKPGDVVVPRTVRTLNNDTNAKVDESLYERAVRAGGMRIETLLTAQHLVQKAEEKKRLAFFGEAVDMESAYVIAKCAEAHIPCVTARGISDAFDEDLPIDFDRCLTPQGAVKTMNLLNAIVERPSGLPKLIRFGRQSTRAIHGLIGFLDHFVTELSGVEAAAR